VEAVMAGATYLDKAKGRIDHVLIVYPYTYINPYNCLPPIGAEYLQAGAVEAGRTTTLLDMRFEDDIREHVEKADLVCLYGFFEDCSLFGKWDVHVIDEVLAQVPEDTPVVAGGTGFGDDERTLAAYPKVDAVIVGMPNDPIQELLESGSPVGVENLTYRTRDGHVRNKRVTRRLSDDVYPRRELRNPKYRYEAMGMPIDLVRAAMGCNYHCRFCYQYGKDTDGKYLRWQGRSPESQFKELSEIKAPLVLWVDDDMTTDMAALERLSELLIENKVEKVMIGTGRVDHVIKGTVETLKKMERAGFLALAFGVESLSDKTLRFYRKGQTVEMAKKAMAMLKQTNILLVCNFLLGSPGETEEDMMEYLWFGGRYQVDHLVTNRLRVPEGSYLSKLIYDQETGEALPGMDRIRGRRLKGIKNRIKFGQGTPFRLWLSFLKLHRHRGLHLDPLYFLCSALETITKHTWIEKTGLLKALLFLPKRLGALRGWRAFTRFVAILATPVALGLAKFFEALERRIGLFTRFMPWLFVLGNQKVLKKQKEKAQHAPGRMVEVASLQTVQRV
jgi:tRNA A37 methylthiotransferase MiaB